MTRDFLVGARPFHNDRMLRLGLRQLAESEVLLRKLLAAYAKSRTPELAREIAQECAFVSQTLDALTDMACRQAPGLNFVASGCLMRASRYLRELVEKAELLVSQPGDTHGDLA
jgi:hypothetical protein